MSVQRACDVCRMYKQGRTFRFGLSRQVPHETLKRENGRPAFKHERGWGGIDLCLDCWESIGKPKTRPELRGKTGPKAVAA